METEKYQYKYQLIELEEAIALIKENLNYDRKKQTETVPLKKSLGRITSEDIISPISQPPFDRSPYDGYALRSDDVITAAKENPAVLKVIGEVDAGDVFSGSIKQKETVRIMTGAPIPDGADCVIRQEDTDYGEDTVQIFSTVAPRDNICRAGEDFMAGDCLIHQDTYITAVEAAILASMGYTHVTVYKKPRVGVFTTGDELSAPGIPLAEGKIYNSNLYLLWGRLTEMGVEPVHIEALPDTESQAAEILAEHAKHLDLIITTGGVSVGKKDIIHGTLLKMGAEKIFWKIRMKPGTPTIFALYNKVPMISLSGNPFGAAANLELLVRSALFEMTGNESLILDRKQAVMQDIFEKSSKVTRYIRGMYQDGKVFQPKGLQSSGVLGSMGGCNCFIEIPKGNMGLHPGDTIDVLLWNE